MTPEKFINIWTANDLTERAGAQSFMEDLCSLLKLDKPRSSNDYCYEKGAIKDSGTSGWADVWKRDHFGWENKKPGRSLEKALTQLREYSGNLGNPPLLIVCDRERIEIHTVFRGYPDEPRTILLQDIGIPENQQILRWVFTDPDKLKPLKSDAAITSEAAGQFSNLAKAMRDRDIEPQQVAHFLTQCIFCMFAEDEGLLHSSPTDDSKIFTAILKAAHTDPDKAANRIKMLFTAMQKKGGTYGSDDIAWFNGGLFKIINVPPLTESDLSILYHAASSLDWRAIDPTIFGTLFERGLDPNCRAQLGAHYTDVATINKLIDPLITRPLTAEWEAAKIEMIEWLEKSNKTKAATQKKHRKTAQDLYHSYLERLRNFRVLDAACGSGNFLYLALHALKDLEHRAQIDAESLGFGKQLNIETGTDNILGIETNEYAAELARVTVWIGEIQWCQRNGRPINKNPILNSLDGIQHRDALLNDDGTETEWPAADVIIGNPPFLGDKMMRGELGDDYVTNLRNCYKGRVQGGADLVCYWFDKARGQIENGQAKAAGLVSTNSIRQKRNRVVLEKIIQVMPIFEAWADEDWFDAGTAVRVSLVCFGDVGLNTILLASESAAIIHADLTASADADDTLDLTQAKPLIANKDRSFFGLCLAGPFKVDTATALAWLQDTGNPNNRPNYDVVRPIYNGSDITRHWADNWVVDFAGMEEADAADYLAPFAYVEEKVKPVRAENREAIRAEKWWQHGRSRPAMRVALHGLTHYLTTPETAKHRFFVKFPVQVAPEHSLIVISRQDDVTLGILSSRLHCVWALAKGGTLGSTPRYNASLTFETFPFPPGFDIKAKAVTEDEPFQAIAKLAADLNTWREKWLNPEDWLDWEITHKEQAAGFPPRPIPKPEHAAEWKKRTLTNLYNEMPNGLKLRQEKLDKAVAKAYGWNDYTPEMTDAEILQRLLKLNLAYHQPHQPDEIPPIKPATKRSEQVKKAKS